MPASLDDTMQRASVALAKLDYLASESLCLEALTAAREQQDWARYQRILLPLQEVRRQRRMTAAEGVVRLGTSGATLCGLAAMRVGCLLVTRPMTPGESAQLLQSFRDDKRYVEVLFADNPSDAARWSIRSFQGLSIEVTINAPPGEWVDRDMTPPHIGSPGSAADFFIDATEAIGDAALAWVDRQCPPTERDTAQAVMRVELLESCLDVVADHELLHQALASAVKGLRLMGR
ncbi:MAG: hypothetical protein GC164_06515 [Phycisphaera sp.]|nr:hypothetical protein [Phycisphaera sp.]